MSLKILKPNLSFKVEGAANVWPEGDPITNVDILRNNVDTKDKPEKFLHEMADRVARSYGFRSRYLIRKPWEKAQAQEESSESLCQKAVAKILEKKTKYKPGAFILGTTTTRRYTGSQATSVLGKFSIEAPAYEIKAGCSTSLASLHLAQALMKQGYDSVLVSCAETLSKVMHPEIRETWFGLADGGAALALKKAAKGDFKILKSTYSTDGRLVDLYTTPGDLPPSEEALAEHGYALVGDGAKLKDAAKVRYLQMIKAMLNKKERTSLKWIIPHQVNRLLTDEVIKETGLSGEVLWDSDTYGNIGGASILFTLAKAIEEKRFKKNDTIFFMSVGGGLSFASQYWKKT